MSREVFDFYCLRTNSNNKLNKEQAIKALCVSNTLYTKKELKSLLNNKEFIDFNTFCFLVEKGTTEKKRSDCISQSLNALKKINSNLSTDKLQRLLTKIGDVLDEKEIQTFYQIMKFKSGDLVDFEKLQKTL